MIEMAEQLTINRPVDDVWAVLADFGAIARWASNVDHSSMTTVQADGIGARRRVQVGRNALLETITEWEPNRRLGYDIWGLPPIVRSVTNTWTLEPSGSSTVATLTSQIDAGPQPPKKIAGRLFGKALAKASRTMLNGLKAELEDPRP